MPLLTIQEPASVAQAKKRAVGIDLGTTHSLVALENEKGVLVLSDENNNQLIPSVVHFDVDKVVVGEKALKALHDDSENVIVSVKRQLLEPALKLKKQVVSPIHVSAYILQKMLNIAHQFDDSIKDAVITVPAYFDEAKRQATFEAAKIAGINVLRLLNEPTAAALAYGLERDAKGYCLIYDLGGGTFDVSLLELTEGVFEVLATGGDTVLGGDDFDALLANWMLKQAGLTQVQVNYPQLLHYARKIKETLTEKESVAFCLESGFQGEITRQIFNGLIMPLLEKTLNIVTEVLKDAKIAKNDIAHVVLVGGSTRVNCVEEQVTQFFGKAPLKDIDPDKVVAIGAALQANKLIGNKSAQDKLLLDVNPLSLGIEMMGGLVEKIIMRNTPVPALAKERFTTYQDGQTGFSLHVVQGERELAQDCRSLAKFELTGLPSLPAGHVKIEVSFKVDADGLLSVEAVELATQKRAQIEVKPTYGLSQNQISHMIDDSVKHAEKDIQERKRIHADIDANTSSIKEKLQKSLEGKSLHEIEDMLV